MNYKNINQCSQNEIPQKISKESSADWISCFTKAYTKELDDMHCPDTLQASMQSQIKENRISRQKKTSPKYIQQAAVAAVVFCLAVIIINRTQIISFAESLIQSFTLYSNGHKKMELDALNPVSFDKQAFCPDPGTEMRETNDIYNNAYHHYWQTFAAYEEMHSLTGFSLPNASLLHYYDISLDVDFEHGYGHLTTYISYEGTRYHANGMFVTDTFDHQENWGYGEDRKINEIYEYADGRSAYFFKKTDTHGTDTVYFVADNIMFQLFVPASDENWENTKQLLAVMAN